jgi:hypothetical protein
LSKLESKRIEIAMAWRRDQGRDPEPDERAAIEKVLRAEADDYDPILSIRIYGGFGAQVRTGFVFGFLDGRGNTYSLVKSRTGWKIIITGIWYA